MTFVICSSRLLMFLGSLCRKQYGARSDCFLRSSLIRVHIVCFHKKIWYERHLNICRQQQLYLKISITCPCFNKCPPPIWTLRWQFWTILGKTKASNERPLEKMEKKRKYLTLQASELVVYHQAYKSFFS